MSPSLHALLTLTGQLLSNGGQNPTVKIRWGDEDGEQNYRMSLGQRGNGISTNQAVGSFSTTVTIPNLEKVYYFRAWASNAGGTVVSNKVGVFVPSAPVGVANLQGRWNFDGGNANDSSGKNKARCGQEIFRTIRDFQFSTLVRRF